MHETFVRPLGEVERQAFYEDMKVVAQLFGTPASVLPGSFSDFQADQRERLESGEIVVTGAAREVAETVLRPPVPVALRPALEALGPLTVGLLPERAPRPRSEDAPLRPAHGVRTLGLHGRRRQPALDRDQRGHASGGRQWRRSLGSKPHALEFCRRHDALDLLEQLALLQAHVLVQEVAERPQRFRRDLACGRPGSERAHETVQLHVLAQDALEHRGRAGVADVEREQDLLLAPEVLDRLGEERVEVRARHGQPLLGLGAGRPEQAPRVRELVVVLLRQRDKCRVASHGSLGLWGPK
jgi:hypothetical protein